MERLTINQLSKSYKQALSKAQEGYKRVLNIQPKPTPLPFSPPPQNTLAFESLPIIKREDL